MYISTRAPTPPRPPALTKDTEAPVFKKIINPMRIHNYVLPFFFLFKSVVGQIIVFGKYMN